MQNILIAWTRNIHAGIWLSAIFFSAIHLQFYGFFPRIIMGALFGYLVVWSANLWYPIIAHMVFNSLQISIHYVFSLQGKSFATDFSFSYWIILSLIPLAGFFYLFKAESFPDSRVLQNESE
jgi:membrane protease YdiL (CAAX protease family)